MDWSNMLLCEATVWASGSTLGDLTPGKEAPAWSRLADPEAGGAGSPLTLLRLDQRRLTALIDQRGCSRKRKKREKGKRQAGREMHAGEGVGSSLLFSGLPPPPTFL